MWHFLPPKFHFTNWCLILIVATLLIGCEGSAASEEMNEQDFAKILQCFKKVQLPYKIESGYGSDNLLDSAFYHQKILGSPIKWYQLHEQSELNVEGLAPSHENVNCGALLYENEKFVVIDIQDTRIGYDRYLLVCSKNGNIIDGVPVAHISKGRNGDENFDIQQFSQISSSLEIKMTENIKHGFSNTPLEEENTVKTATYQIQSDGKVRFIGK